jgi:hypothetical protein
MTRRERWLADKQIQYGDRFDTSRLAPQFWEAFDRGDTFRVLVQPPYNEKPTWGYVGVTTGWCPTFLLIRCRGQIGSSYTLGHDYKILRTKVKRCDT